MGRDSLGRARIQICRARRHLASGVAAAVGLALVAPALTIGPAQAATGITPTIDGQGTITSLLGDVLYKCESDPALAVTTCPEVPADLLGVLIELTLASTPASGYDQGTWTGCPTVDNTLCSFSALDLLTSWAPVVTFPEITGMPLPEEPEPTPAPETKLTSDDPDAHKSFATFTFVADPEDGSSFECKLDAVLPATAPADSQKRHDWRSEGCHSGLTYTKLADEGEYTFHVRAVSDSGEEALKDTSPETVSWTVNLPSTTSPETTITSGPRNGAWWMRNAVSYRFSSNVEEPRYRCMFDGSTLPGCEDGLARIGRLRAGSHLFQVSAQGDLAAAERRFHVPVDDRRLTEKKRWAERRAKGHFKNTFRQSRARGASLTTRGYRDISKIVLVADKGRGFGTVKVFLGGKMLRKVSLHAQRTQKRRVIAIKSFTGSRSGKVRVVVVSARKVVRIDGIGVATR